jgi:hypothetical protein
LFPRTTRGTPLMRPHLAGVSSKPPCVLYSIHPTLDHLISIHCTHRAPLHRLSNAADARSKGALHRRRHLPLSPPSLEKKAASLSVHLRAQATPCLTHCSILHHLVKVSSPTPPLYRQRASPEFIGLYMCATSSVRLGTPFWILNWQAPPVRILLTKFSFPFSVLFLF